MYNNDNNNISKGNGIIQAPKPTNQPFLETTTTTTNKLDIKDKKANGIHDQPPKQTKKEPFQDTKKVDYIKDKKVKRIAVSPSNVRVSSVTMGKQTPQPEADGTSRLDNTRLHFSLFVFVKFTNFKDFKYSFFSIKYIQFKGIQKQHYA